MDKDMIGLIVKSKKGRDIGKTYIISGEVDPYHVSLIDGRKFDFKRQKRKNKKHLCIITKAEDDIIQGIINQDEKCLKTIFRLTELEAKEV